MSPEILTKKWFALWETGDYLSLPLANNFRHISPYGTVSGKQAYLDLITRNSAEFLGHNFLLHEMLHDENVSAIRYTAIKGDFRLEVSEWHYILDGKISEVVAYYNIDEERIKIK